MNQNEPKALQETTMAPLHVDYRALITRADLVYQRPVEHPVEGQPIGNGHMGTLVSHHARHVAAP